MEINRVLGNIVGGVVSADTVEGRMVCLSTHSETYDFGSKADLPGLKVPATAEEAKRARLVVSYPEDNRSTPIYQATPSFPFAQREGWNQTANVPFSATVHLTLPGHTLNPTIPSGSLALGYGRGTYTLTTGQYIASGIVVGSLLSVSYSGADAGKLQLLANMDADVAVAVAEAVDSTTGRLTFTTLNF